MQDAHAAQSAPMLTASMPRCASGSGPWWPAHQARSMAATAGAALHEVSAPHSVAGRAVSKKGGLASDDGLADEGAVGLRLGTLEAYGSWLVPLVKNTVRPCTTSVCNVTGGGV
jgi:hypothetical protein